MNACPVCPRLRVMIDKLRRAYNDRGKSMQRRSQVIALQASRIRELERENSKLLRKVERLESDMKGMLAFVPLLERFKRQIRKLAA